MAKPGNSKKPHEKLAQSLHPMTHMELFAYLIKHGPTMHGTPGVPKGHKS